MRLFNPYLYANVHLLIILVFTLYYFLILKRKNAQKLLQRKESRTGVYFYALIFIIVVGFRPVSAAFGDTVTYARTYEYFSQLPFVPTDLTHDTLFYLFMWFCSQYLSVSLFFFILEILYVVPIIIACNRLLKNNSDIGLLFCLSAFSFFTYGTNGLRNGVALSLIFLALTLIRGRNWEKVLCGFLCLIAVALHKSAMLPVLGMIGSLLVRKPKYFFYFWLISIVISLSVGNVVANFFGNLGFDDRLQDYLLHEADEEIFSRVGFRWDFLLYSACPIALGYYVMFKKRVCNSTYLLLLGTYMISNAFWIMVIRAPYSNRFAYLSWFLYPIVLAYPLLRLRIWPRTQGQKAALIMAAHYAFTFIMSFVI